MTSPDPVKPEDKPTSAPSPAPKADPPAKAPEDCPVCARRLNDEGFCSYCGYQA